MFKGTYVLGVSLSHPPFLVDFHLDLMGFSGIVYRWIFTLFIIPDWNMLNDRAESIFYNY